MFKLRKSLPNRIIIITYLWSQGLHPLEEHLAGRVNLLLTREEEQDITGRLVQMDLHHDRDIYII